MKNKLPSLLTLAGVACGFASLIYLMNEQYIPGMLWMFMAVVFDGIDGKVAALLDSKSELGMHIDSLSDAISFGLLPGIAIFLLYARVPEPNILTQIAAWTLGIGYTCAGILRETRFVSGQSGRTRSEGFIGLPIAPPAGFNVAILALLNLFPDRFYTTPMLIVIFIIVSLNMYLMTLSKINYLRWGGKAILVQTLAAVLFGVWGYFTLGTFGAFLSIFYITFCMVYILSHLVRAGFARG